MISKFSALEIGFSMKIEWKKVENDPESYLVRKNWKIFLKQNVDVKLVEIWYVPRLQPVLLATREKLSTLCVKSARWEYVICF